MRTLDSIYAQLPVWGQHTAATAFGAYWSWLRFGPGYRKYVREFRDRDAFDAEQWKSWQQEELSRQLHAAANHVPYYRDTWRSFEKHAASAGRIEELPLLEKQPLRENSRRFVRDDMRTMFESTTRTSGSTGTPIENFWTPAEVRRRLAIREARSANWANVSFRMPRATFHGRMVVPDPLSPGPFHRFNAVESQTYLSAFHLQPNNASQYVNAINRNGVRWMTGYAVSFHMLAKYILEQGLRVSPDLQAIVTTSEKLTSSMRDELQQAFGCSVFEEYGSVENVVFASECAHGRLHVSPDVGFVEILRSDGTPCDPGEPGELVVTSLMRKYQPFVRYRIGDVATWDDRPCPCGRALPVLEEVVGRTQDVVIGQGGRRMMQFYGMFANTPNIREAQVVQETLDRLRLNIVPTDDFCSADAQKLIHSVKQRLGPRMEVIVNQVQDIPRSKAGKFRAVVSLLNEDDLKGFASSSADQIAGD